MTQQPQDRHRLTHSEHTVTLISFLLHNYFLRPSGYNLLISRVSQPKEGQGKARCQIRFLVYPVLISHGQVASDKEFSNGWSGGEKGIGLKIISEEHKEKRAGEITLLAWRK